MLVENQRVRKLSFRDRDMGSLPFLDLIARKKRKEGREGERI